MRRRACLKMSSNFSISSGGAIRGMAESPGVSSGPFVNKEGIDQVVERVVGANPVVNADQEMVTPFGRRFHTNIENIDARLPTDQGAFHSILHHTPKRWRVGLEREVVNSTTELRPHLALSLRSFENDPYALANLVVTREIEKLSRRRRFYGKCPTSAEHRRIHVQPPITTVLTATTVPTGRSTGSLHVNAVSPDR